MAFRKMTAALVVASALLMAPGAASAQTADPETLGVARELMDLTVGDDLQRKLTDQSWPAIEPAIRKAAPQLTADQLAELKADYVKLSDENMAVMMARVPDIYAKYFSAQELRDMLAFYRTPTGKKTIEVMPALGGEMMQIIAPQMPAMMEKMSTSFTRVLRDKGITLPAQPQ